jgi:hypothetical protein
MPRARVEGLQVPQGVTPERKVLLRALVMSAYEHGNTIREQFDWLANDTAWDDDSLVLELAEKDLLERFPPTN